MAAAKVSLYHRDRHRFCMAPVGFSWTTLVFGPFPLRFRHPVAWMLMWTVALFALITLLLSDVVFAFFVNRLYIRSLIKKGYRIRGISAERLDEFARMLGYSREALVAVCDFGDAEPPQVGMPEAKRGDEGELNPTAAGDESPGLGSEPEA